MAKRKFKLAAYLLRKWYWALAVGLSFAVLAALTLASRPQTDANGKFTSYPYGLVTPLEEFGLDILFQMRNVLHPDMLERGSREPITIIAVDEPTIKESQIRLQGWPRSYYAKLIERASNAGASVIGVDVYFSEHAGQSDEAKADDQKLIDAITNAGNVIIVKKLPAGGSDAITPLPEFQAAVAAVGFADLPRDSDGFVRTSSLGHTAADGSTDLSFASYIAETHAELQEPMEFRPDLTVKFGDRVIPLRNDTNLQIDFRRRSPGFNYVSAGDILFKDPSAVSDELFKDRIVMIGATNNDAPDLFQTPYYKPGLIATFWARVRHRQIDTAPKLMPGVEAHANVVATMLYGQYLRQVSYAPRVLMLLVVIGLVTLAVFKFRASLGALTVVLVAFGVLAASAAAFNRRMLILPLMTSEVGVGVLALSGFLLRYAHERAVREEKEAERAQIMDIFSRAVSPEVADKLWEQRDGLRLGGERRVVTLIFTDIRGFTTLTENAPNSEIVVTWLNEYFSRMHKIIAAHGGHINKYIGDGLMIVFGAPIARGDRLEANAAVSCGLEMLEEVKRINKDWQQINEDLKRNNEDVHLKGRPGEIKIGVGIHTGEASCGVVGAENRLEYTIIGDAVNLSSRLESTTKEQKVEILISEATQSLLSKEYETRQLGNVKVKGKEQETTVYTVQKAGAHKPAPAPATVA
jgi:adenylate cyclase